MDLSYNCKPQAVRDVGHSKHPSPPHSWYDAHDPPLGKRLDYGCWVVHKHDKWWSVALLGTMDDLTSKVAYEQQSVQLSDKPGQVSCESNVECR